MKQTTSINVWLITIFSLMILMSGGYFFYQFMQEYSYNTYMKDAKECYANKEYQCAIISSNLAEEFNPNGVDLLEFKGDLFLHRYKNYKKAIGHYSLAIDRSQGEQQAAILFKRAKVYQKENEINLCKADLLIASRLGVDSVNLYLAEIYNYNDRDYQQAIIFYSKEKKMIKTSFIVTFGLAFAYYNNSEYKQAISFFDQCIVMIPSSGESYYFRGLSYNSIYEQDKACKDYLKAIDLGYSRAYINHDALCH